MKIKSSFDILYIFIGIPWIFMMIATSRGFTVIKTGMLVILSIVAFMEFLEKRKRFFIKEFSYLLLFLGYYSISLFLGIMSGYEFSFTTDFGLIILFHYTYISSIA